MGIFRKTFSLFAVIAALFILFIVLGANFLGDLMWFQALGFQRVFLLSLLSRWGLRLVAVIIFWIILFLNFYFTLPVIEANWRIDIGDNAVPLRKYIWEKFVTPRRLRLFFILAGLVLAVILSPVVDQKWLTVLKYLNSSPFNVQDPLFGMDIGFYIFKLPLYKLIYNFLLTALTSCLVLAFLIYVLFAPWELGKIRNSFSRPWKHIGILLALIFIVKAFGYRLNAFDLVYSARGVTFGAGYTDVHAILPALKILSILAVITGILLLFGLYANRWKVSLAGFVVLLAASGILGIVYPGIVQKLQVEPNEMAAESTYLKYNIDFTQKAYNLDNVEVREFPVDNDLDWNALNQYQGTIENIRLWDWRPLQQTFNQLQSLRPYYRFLNVDIDRYQIDGQYRQLMLSARELDQRQLSDQAQTWVNQRLLFTHGYGVVASTVNELTPEGLPNLILSNIPVQGPRELEIQQPQIYYGEADNENVVVNSKTEEFDYPKGSENSYNHYSGQGGIALDTLFKRLVFAVKFADYRLLFTGDITSDSRIMFNRNIMERVQKIAPFLSYDSDPYLVIDNGKLYWMIDAYTTSEDFPYAEPYQGMFNYLRNPVKVVIDAYQGTVDFYLISQEPIILSLNNIFDGIFKPFNEMPEGLKKHIRYPENLFKVQAEMYTQYHMENTQVFYNREDAWEIPSEVYEGAQMKVEPYYNIIQLPGDKQGEYLLMIPFKPARQLENMVAWMAGRSDGDNYGKLLVYTFPKGKHVYGTSQVEARIDQDSVISQQLTLWDQRGSQVIRGNLLVIPIANSLLYVEPIFLQAEQSQLPELTRVIVNYGEKIVMTNNLEQALGEIFGSHQAEKTVEGKASVEENNVEDNNTNAAQQPGNWQELAQSAGILFKEAQQAQQAGDWAAYGEKLNLLQKALQDLQKLSVQ